MKRPLANPTNASHPCKPFHELSTPQCHVQCRSRSPTSSSTALSPPCSAVPAPCAASLASLAFPSFPSFSVFSFGLGPLSLVFVSLLASRLTTYDSLTSHVPRLKIHDSLISGPFPSSMSLASFLVRHSLNQFNNGGLHKSAPQGPSIIHLGPHPPRL